MRQVVLDTETTGLDPTEGHRIIELGGVELVHRRPSGRHYHQYLQPEREIDEGALEVHGITKAFLADKPRFADIVEDFLAFINGAELIIHNAGFDVAFIDAELARVAPELGGVEGRCRVLDTLELARQLHPGQKNTLDALCKRYSVDDSARELHGALLDARILADIYLAMTGGQTSLALASDFGSTVGGTAVRRLAAERPRLTIIRADDQELQLHQQRLQDIEQASESGCLWLKLEPSAV